MKIVGKIPCQSGRRQNIVILKQCRGADIAKTACGLNALGGLFVAGANGRIEEAGQVYLSLQEGRTDFEFTCVKIDISVPNIQNEARRINIVWREQKIWTQRCCFIVERVSAEELEVQNFRLAVCVRIINTTRNLQFTEIVQRNQIPTIEAEAEILIIQF